MCEAKAQNGEAQSAAQIIMEQSFSVISMKNYIYDGHLIQVTDFYRLS